jgi:starch synthase
MTRVLSVASECAPLVKTGGLADVVGALPAALARQGVEMRTLLPYYPAVQSKVTVTGTLFDVADLFGGPARILSATSGALDLILIDAGHLYDRAGSIYLGPDGRDWGDNPERFAALSWIAAKTGAEGAGGWTPEVIHAHDWQAGFVPEYLHMMGATSRVGTILTIHNIAFHGLADPGRLGALRLNRNRYTREGFEFWGRISALKAGLMGADRLTTVSPTYAAELMRDEFGMGLDGVMRLRRDALSGILNGIDEDVWNPATDPAIIPYKSLKEKTVNKQALRTEMGLPDSAGPLCCVVSRLTEQKGLDLLLETLPTLLHRGGQLALLGSGEKWMEDAFRNAARDANVAVKIGYDEGLSHRLIAGSDAILVPSRFEPCGLTQLYGLRYGTIPVVALTGGLADTVIHASPAALGMGVASGIQFSPVTADALRGALVQSCDLYAQPAVWEQMQGNAMRQPVGWGPSAKAYAGLYRDVTKH